jgi:hypothetical protein
MTEQKTVIHRLTNRDEKTLTGECSVCGLVAIRRAGNGYRCAVKLAEKHSAWAKKNPAKARANRRSKSDHKLFAHDYVAAKATCAVCGPVDIVMWGAGYACGPHARTLRTVQQDALAGQKCRECAIIDGYTYAPRMRADGTCPRCSDPRVADTGAMLRDQEHNALHGSPDRVPAGFHVVHPDGDPADMPAYESAVPGWKTLGSSRPWSQA